jgi:uncharacterized Ntn-hydrolase superfamily protein
VTFSIVAFDPVRGDWGVAVASKFPAVGAVVPWARAGVGAIATQSFANVDYGPHGLDLMAGGMSALEALDALVTADHGRAQRQAGAVDAQGRAATFTGDECVAWAGGTTGEGFACQGNILVGPEVVDAMAAAYAGTDGDLVDRLMAALEAGDAAGGDRRGRQSAAVLVVREHGGYAGRGDRYIDLRVDDHPEAVRELRRVFTVFDQEFLIRDDAPVEPTETLIRELQGCLIATGHYRGEPTGTLDDATKVAIEDFAARFNLENKVNWNTGELYESVVREIREVAAAQEPTG